MLRLENISKVFKPNTVDEKALFSDFSFVAEKGEFISVIGSNGSGKTTMLNIISGEVKPDSGKVILGGTDITSQKDYVRSKRVARVYQDPSQGTCPTMTILENMSIADNKGKRFGLGRGLNTKRADYYKTRLEVLGMGLENRLGTQTGSLSGGQRQALALIMATLKTPDVLLLDEHTAALDPKSADIVMKLTDEIVKGENITTIMVTHNLRYAAEYGSRTVMMHDGKAIMDIRGNDKKNNSVNDYLDVFNSISIECGN